MACKRSAVRSRLAPPAFACFASYGSASHAAAHRSEASEGCRVVARRATTGLGKLYRSEGCRAVARRGEGGLETIFTSLRAKRSNPERSRRKAGLLRRYAPRNDGVGLRPGICEEAAVMLNALYVLSTKLRKK